MKKFNKVLSVILALIMTFSLATTVICYAESEAPAGNEDVIPGGENPIEDLLPEEDEDGNLHVSSWRQLKFAIIFKIIDKLVKFFENLFA